MCRRQGTGVALQHDPPYRGTAHVFTVWQEKCLGLACTHVVECYVCAVAFLMSALLSAACVPMSGPVCALVFSMHCASRVRAIVRRFLQLTVRGA
jgi:hypothetical protein